MVNYLQVFKKIGLFLLVISLVSACSNSTGIESEKSMQLDKSSHQEAELQTVDQSDAKEGTKPTTAIVRKLIKTANLEIETKKFEKTIDTLEKSVSEFNGYIESNHITGTSILEKYNEDNIDDFPSRTAQYTLRIPTNKLNAYLSKINTIGNVTSKSISTEDISNQYFDTETRIKSLKIQEERLLNLLKKSGSLSDIIELEKELSTVRYEIESLTTTIKTYDSLINYSTINLSVTEVAEITDTTPPKTVSDRITAKFKDNLKNISTGFKNTTVFIIGNSVLIIIWLIILVAGFFIARKAMKKYQDWNIPK
ncbi:DUF4349 domain-containing protein [Bacillus sp. OAE603]|uniref:DUF4349 domain-containing protein n=1 Tax=Gottfriedia sp. OAE603 TaxID=2663872 RepID=UPI00178A237E